MHGAGPTEHQTQAAFHRFMQLKYPHVISFAVPNAAKRGPALASRMKAEGMVAGIPDYFIDFATPDFHGLRIEFKRNARAKLTDAQAAMAERYKRAGYRWELCCDFDSAAALVKEYLR